MSIEIDRIIYWKEYEKRPPMTVIPEHEKYGGRYVCDDDRVDACGFEGYGSIDEFKSWFTLLFKDGTRKEFHHGEDWKELILQAERYLKYING